MNASILEKLDFIIAIDMNNNRIQAFYMYENTFWK